MVKTIKESRPNLGRILERKAKIVDFDFTNRFISVYIPSGGLREPEEIINDFIAELSKFDTTSWRIETPRNEYMGNGLKTLYEKQKEKKDDKINLVKENTIIRKILNELVEAEIVDVISLENKTIH